MKYQRCEKPEFADAVTNDSYGKVVGYMLQPSVLVYISGHPLSGTDHETGMAQTLVFPDTETAERYIELMQKEANKDGMETQDN